MRTKTGQRMLLRCLMRPAIHMGTMTYMRDITRYRGWIIHCAVDLGGKAAVLTKLGLDERIRVYVQSADLERGQAVSTEDNMP